jgi:hypothetical protein
MKLIDKEKLEFYVYDYKNHFVNQLKILKIFYFLRYKTFGFYFILNLEKNIFG